MAATTAGISERKFIYIDMDSFFVSVELLDSPHLGIRPVAVGGTAAERGVISTANYIARKFGVKSGMATATAHRLCPDLVLLPVRFGAYEAVTRKLDEIFRRYTDKVEFLSLDEAALDVTGQTCFNGSATLIAAHIRATVRQELGLTASAGVAPLKYLAKIASEMKKPDGMFVITPSQVRAFLEELDVRKIPGVGPKTYAVLENLGCGQCKDVTEEKIPALMRYLGVHGFYVWERCQGIEERDERGCDIKSVGIERTLPLDCDTLSYCLKELDRLSEGLRDRIAELGSDYLITKNLVKLKFSDFSISSTEAPANSLCQPTVTSLCRVLWNTRRNGRSVRLIGLSVKVQKKDQDDNQLAFSW
jgi:DNA polymerase-4